MWEQTIMNPNHIYDFTEVQDHKACSACKTVDYTWERTGRWIICSDCTEWICGNCVSSKIFDGPSGPGDEYCWKCIHKYKIEEGKFVCKRCEKTFTDKDCICCEHCDFYYCEQCVGESFEEVPELTLPGGSKEWVEVWIDVCRTCYEKHNNTRS